MKTVWKIIQILLIAVWAVLLLKANSFVYIYILTAAAGIVTVILNKKKTGRERHRAIRVIFAVILSGAVTLANYDLFGLWFTSKAVMAAAAVALFISGLCVFMNIIGWACTAVEHGGWKAKIHKLKPGMAFFISAAILTVIYAAVWALAYFPGILSPDSVNQINQTYTGVYSNHHPVFHTIIIQGCLWIGRTLFGTAQAGVAVYSLVQILAMACSAAYILMTMQQIGVTYKLSVPVFLFFAVMPYNILYSFTMWKDVLFSAAMALFILDLFRIMNGIGGKAANAIMLAISTLGTCLLRTNGLPVVAVTFIIAIFVMGRKHVKTLILVAAVIVVSVVLKYPMLSALNINQPDTIESLSIPAQQIGRVMAEGEEITDEQKELLANVVEVDKIAENYQWYTSEKLKELVRATDNQEYIKEHKTEFIKMYIQMAVQHPVSFVESWIDGTKGYWNGGYDMWNWTVVEENDYAVERVNVVEGLSDTFDSYADAYNNIFVLQPFVSVGLWCWVIVILFAAGLAARKKEALLALPCILIVLTLLVATPIYNEFRYAYSLFTSMPVIILAMFYRNGGNTVKNKNS